MLRGSLSTISLAGLVQILCAERRTGRVEVRFGTGAAARRGAIWLEAGRIVHAESEAADTTGPRGAGPRTGEDALHDLVPLEAGDFAFEPGVAASRRTVTGSTEALLVEAACRRDVERRAPAEIAVLPASVPGFAPVPEGVATPRFNTLQWRLLAAVDGRRDVVGLAKTVGLSPEAACALVRDLVAAGVLRLQD
jgi:hypothetical protein